MYIFSNWDMFIVTYQLLKSIILVENAETLVLSANDIFLLSIPETRAPTSSPLHDE